MIQIQQYNIKKRGQTNITLPRGAQVMTIQLQPTGNVTMWCMVNTAVMDNQLRTFQVFLTGEPFPEAAAGELFSFVDTVQDGNVAYHIFEIKQGQLPTKKNG